MLFELLEGLFISVLTYFITKYYYTNYNDYYKNMKYPRKSKSIYVAGAWIHRKILQDEMDNLRSLGYDITSNWPDREERMDTPDDFAECSKYDIKEVIKADTILAFMTNPKYAYRGTFTEIGCAIGAKRRIIVVCNGTCVKKSEDKYEFKHECMNNIFFWDPNIEHVSSLDDAIVLLNGGIVKSPFSDFYNGVITRNLEYPNNERKSILKKNVSWVSY